MKAVLFAALIMVFLASCTSSRKFKDVDELGKEVFSYFKKGAKSEITDQLITKEEIYKVFSTDPGFRQMSEEQKKGMINSAYENQTAQAMIFIDMYTGEDDKMTSILQKGEFLKVSSRLKPENGPAATRIEVVFQSGSENYVLKLDAAKIDDYWKLLSWIEVEKYYGE